MKETSNPNRILIIIFGVIALIFVNAGIFYTAQISHQAAQLDTLTIDQISTAVLDTKNVQTLEGRTHIDVEADLIPYQSGRTNPLAP